MPQLQSCICLLSRLRSLHCSCIKRTLFWNLEDVPYMCPRAEWYMGSVQRIHTSNFRVIFFLKIRSLLSILPEEKRAQRIAIAIHHRFLLQLRIPTTNSTVLHPTEPIAPLHVVLTVRVGVVYQPAKTRVSDEQVGDELQEKDQAAGGSHKGETSQTLGEGGNQVLG